MKGCFVMLPWVLLCGCLESKTGGDCSYEDYPGTCVYDDAGHFTFSGNVEGKEVSFEGNSYTPGLEEQAPAAGSSVGCTLSYITQGTCTPCVFDIGECGSDAFAGHP